MIEIKKANTTFDYSQIETLANTIWRDHYISVIGKPQVDYMLAKFQSVDAIAEQIEKGAEYFKIEYKKTSVGYLAIKKETDTLFLSKFYVLSDYRGKGIGKQAMSFIFEQAARHQLNQIKLTVNKDNSASIKIYEKLGFIKADKILIDIGNGFVMDDYLMVKEI